MDYSSTTMENDMLVLHLKGRLRDKFGMNYDTMVEELLTCTTSILLGGPTVMEVLLGTHWMDTLHIHIEGSIDDVELDVVFPGYVEGYDQATTVNLAGLETRYPGTFRRKLLIRDECHIALYGWPSFDVTRLSLYPTVSETIMRECDITLEANVYNATTETWHVAYPNTLKRKGYVMHVDGYTSERVKWYNDRGFQLMIPYHPSDRNFYLDPKSKLNRDCIETS